MANPTIKIKRSAVSGKIPTTSQIDLGELAINTFDGKVYIEQDKSSVGVGTTVIVINPWNVGTGTNTYNTYFTNGNVGVGSTLPTSKLYVVGDAYVTGILTAASGSFPNFNISDTLTIGSQILYAQGNNGFSVNEDFDPSNSSTQTAYHYTSGAGRETVAFTLARTGQFTNGFGIYGTSANNTFVNFGEQNNTNWEWRSGVGIRPLDLDGGTLRMRLSSNGNLGIGTTNATSRIHVIGDARITGILTVGSGSVTIDGSNGIITTTDLQVTNTISGVSSGSQKVSVVTDNGNQWHNVPFLDSATGYQTLKSNGLTYNPYIGKLSAGIGSFNSITGNLTGNINSTGISTIGSIQIGVGNTDVIVGGDMRVTGILTVGNSSLTLDGSNNTVNVGTALTLGHTQGIQFHTQNLHSTGFEVNNINASGVVTSKSFVGNLTGNIYSTGISTISGFRFPSSDGTNGQVLSTDGNGNLSFISASVGGGGAGAATTISDQNFTATQGQTQFTSSQDLTDKSIQVFVNGVKLRGSADYSVSVPTTLTLTEAATVGDNVNLVVAYGYSLDEENFTATEGQTTFELAGALTSAENIKVYVNGVKLRKTVDYGTSASVTLASAAIEGDEVDLVCDNAEDYYTAIEGQTVFIPVSADISGENLQVFMNGVKLQSSTDYSVGSPAITLTNGLVAGDQVDIVITRS